MRKSVDSILALLDKQINIYSQMSELSAEQMDSLSDAKKANSILLAKAELVKDIEKSDVQLATFKEQWHKDKSSFSFEEQAMISEKLKNT